MSNWETIKQVPLSAWFRPRISPNKMFPIAEIDLQYCGGGYMPGLAIKAEPAFMINQQWWKPRELNAVFQVSLDGETWQDCAGEIGGGPIENRVEKIELAVGRHLLASQETADLLQTQIETAQRQYARMEELGRQVAEIQSKAAALAVPPAPQSSQSAPPAGDKKETKKG